MTDSLTSTTEERTDGKSDVGDLDLEKRDLLATVAVITGLFISVILLVLIFRIGTFRKCRKKGRSSFRRRSSNKSGDDDVFQESSGHPRIQSYQAPKIISLRKVEEETRHNTRQNSRIDIAETCNNDDTLH